MYCCITRTQLKQQFCHLCFVEYDSFTIAAVNTQRAQWMSAESRESQIRFPLWILSIVLAMSSSVTESDESFVHTGSTNLIYVAYSIQTWLFILRTAEKHRIWFYRACRAILYWFLKHSSPADFISSFRLDHLMSHFRLGTMYFCLCQLWPWYPFDHDIYFDPDTRFFDESKEHNLFFCKKINVLPSLFVCPFRKNEIK